MAPHDPGNAGIGGVAFAAAVRWSPPCGALPDSSARATVARKPLDKDRRDCAPSLASSRPWLHLPGGARRKKPRVSWPLTDAESASLVWVLSATPAETLRPSGTAPRGGPCPITPDRRTTPMITQIGITLACLTLFGATEGEEPAAEGEAPAAEGETGGDSEES